MADGLYDIDILVWSETQADLLARVARGERVNGVDWEHVVEEIAGVGLSQLNTVHSLLRKAVLPLLSGQSMNKFNWLSVSKTLELSAVCRITDSIEAFSNTVTENTCINV